MFKFIKELRSAVFGSQNNNSKLESWAEELGLARTSEASNEAFRAEPRNRLKRPIKTVSGFGNTPRRPV